MLVMRLFGCEINCELPFLAHNGPSAQLVRSLRGQSGLNGYSVTCFNQPSLLEGNRNLVSRANGYGSRPDNHSKS
ncbi:hypothetical protein E0L11_17100 [Escherichia coli]|nr:hypothetical protein [Escherichia coli]EEW1805946.1 hypothetical protein [Escherichia coli]EEW2016067.1 hypothetical protein [Escherichia coli]EEY8758773.1 hypothetical protein [Escherichia coli]EFA4586974.1 hypothetical protein [Escherichia coli]